jgi:nuclear pore complex protein Nup93
MSSLFSNLGSSQNKPSLFGSQTAGSQSGTSLFGGLNAAKPAQPTSSLFNSQPQSQSQQPQQQSQSGGGLFGSLGSSSQALQQQQQPSTGSLFGALGSTSQPPQQQSQKSSVFGSLGTQSKPNGQAGLGGSTSDLQTQQQQTQQSGAYFDSLLEKSRKRAHGETALEDLPSLQLGLGDLRQRIKRLGPAAQDRDADGRAHYLLASSGVDPGSTVRDLSYFDSQPARVERSQPTAPADTDVEGYLASLQTQTTLSMIADGLTRSVRDFDTFLEDNVTMEWDAQRKRIYHHFGIQPRDGPRVREGESSLGTGSVDQGGFGRSRRSKGQPPKGSRGIGASNGSTFGRLSMLRSVIGTPGPIGTGQTPPFTDVDRKAEAGSGTLGTDPDDRFQREKQGRFADKVQRLNAARLQRRGYSVLEEFAAVEAQSGDQHAEHVVNAYNAVRAVTGEYQENDSLSDIEPAKERQFARAYLDEMHDSPSSIQIRKMILAGATKHLEKRFFNDLEALIAKNPREANLGGVPNVTSKVRAYIRLRAANKDLVPENIDLQMLGDDFVWALVFFLLRSGHTKEAVEYVAGNAVAFRAIDRNFITYITNYHKSKEKRLPRELQDRINNEYNQRVRIAPEHSIDPFRMACYKVIGRCEIEKRDLGSLYSSMEDWVWLQFNLAREVNRIGEIATEVYGLAEVQTTIKGIGARHFSKGGTDQSGGFGVFFYLQILAGLYEEAVKYLYTFQYVEGVHFAIALDYYGLLRVSDLSAPASELLTHSTRGSPQINFSHMIGYYTRDFRAANVVAAVDYLALICLNRDLPGDAGAQQAEQCHEALRELVLESREFAQLLGDVRSDGQRIKGAIEERIKLIGLVDTDDFMRTVIVQAASIADDNGRITDSVLLYHLAGEYDNVMTIINRALSEAIAVDIGQETLPLLPPRPDMGYVAAQQQGGSLSLTAVDDPVALAKNMSTLYGNNSSYANKVSTKNKETCTLLLKMHVAKVKVQEEKWTEVLDVSCPILWHELVLTVRRYSLASVSFHCKRPGTLHWFDNKLHNTPLCHR